jgi:hypothetical protein
MRGELMVLRKSAFIAAEMPSVGETSKYSPGDAHADIRVGISLWKGLIQLLYQSLLGSGR